MKMNIFILLMFSFLQSCKVMESVQAKVVGEYIKIGDDYKYKLAIRPDNTFLFEKSFNPHTHSSCEGKWKKDDKKLKLILDCYEVQDPTELLSSQYMSTRHYVVSIIDSERIELENVVLTKN